MASMSERRAGEKDGASHPLENLNLLEKKIAQLIELVKTEKALNAKLAEENSALNAQLEMVESSLLKEAKSIEELNQEREMTKLVVDELIGSIDRLVQVMPLQVDHSIEQER